MARGNRRIYKFFSGIRILIRLIRQILPIQPMNKIFEIIQKKPALFALVALIYLLFVGLLKWGLRPPTESIWFLLGGLLGIYFLDAAEHFFNLSPSPFRSIVFAALFVAVSVFVVTSSGSLLAIGLVLSMYLSIILWQIGEWQVAKNLNSWYRMVAMQVTTATQQRILIVFLGLFIVLTFLFIR